MPFPHDPEHNPDVLRFDKMTAADRISEIESDLSALEYAALKGFILLCSGATLATMSFYEFLHWCKSSISRSMIPISYGLRVVYLDLS
jgi:hypothetical protein